MTRVSQACRIAPSARRSTSRHEHPRLDRCCGVAAAAVGGAGAALIGSRILSGKSLIPSRFVKKVMHPDASDVFDATDVFRRGNGAA